MDGHIGQGQSSIPTTLQKWGYNLYCISRIYHQIKIKIKIRLCRDRMVIRFITTYAINAYLLSPLTLWVRILLKLGVLDTTLCDKVYQWLVAGRWFSPGTPVSSTNKTDRRDITEILLKVVLNNIALTLRLK